MVSGHASPAAIYAVIWTTTLLAIFAVGLRVFTRAVIVRGLKCDYYLILASLLFVVAFTVTVTLEAYNGLGRRQASLSKSERTNQSLWLWISIILYHIGLGLAKLSIVSQCLSVFGSIRRFVIACYIVGAILIIFTLYTVLVTIFLCRPVSYFWNSEQNGSCLPRLPVWFVNSGFSVVTDIMVAVLPIPVVRSLNLPKRQKCMLSFVFALGGAVCIITIIRFYALYAVTSTTDSSYENPQAALYSNVEVSVAIMGSCLPTYNAFIAKYFPRFYHGSLGGGPRSDNIIQIELRSNSGAPTSSSGTTADTRRFWKSARSSSKNGASTSEASRGLSQTTTQIGTLFGIDEERQAQESQNQLALGMARYNRM